MRGFLFSLFSELDRKEFGIQHPEAQADRFTREFRIIFSVFSENASVNVVAEDLKAFAFFNRRTVFCQDIHVNIAVRGSGKVDVRTLSIKNKRFSDEHFFVAVCHVASKAVLTDFIHNERARYVFRTVIADIVKNIIFLSGYWYPVNSS